MAGTVQRTIHQSNKLHMAVILFLLFATTDGVIEPSDGRKTPTSTDFASDKDIVRYLALHNKDVMLHSCENGVEVTYKQLPVSIELRCQILGRVKSLQFRHNNKLLPTGSPQYSLTAYPHTRDGQYFSRWLDYTLHIRQATLADQGMYSVSVTGSSGLTHSQMIFVTMKEASKPQLRNLNTRKERTKKSKKKKRAREGKRRRKNKDRRRRKRKDKRRRKSRRDRSRSKKKRSRRRRMKLYQT